MKFLAARRGIAAGLVLMFAAVALSACTQAPDQPLATDGDTGDATGVRGRVVSEEVFPVVGANVTIEDGPSTFTDEAGGFELLGVEPGHHTILVTAEGYEQTSEEVNVAAGSVVELFLTIAGLPGQAPYLETIIFEGFSACTFSAVYSAGPFPPLVGAPCPWGEPKTGTSVEVGAEWQAGVHEIAWETEEEMIFASSLVSSCQTGGPDGPDPCPYLGWGKSPIQVFARINDTDYAAKHAIDGEAMWHGGAHESHIFSSYSGFFREEINETAYPVCVAINNQFNVPEHWGCPFGVGYSTGLRFTMYHTTFYREAPPALETFTAIPDQ